MNKRVKIFWAGSAAMVAGWIFLIYLTSKEPASWLLITIIASAALFVLIDALRMEMCVIITDEYRIVEKQEMCATLVKRKYYVIQRAYDNLLSNTKHWKFVASVNEKGEYDSAEDAEKQAKYILSNIKKGENPGCHVKTKVLA